MGANVADATPCGYLWEQNNGLRMIQESISPLPQIPVVFHSVIFILTALSPFKKMSPLHHEVFLFLFPSSIGILSWYQKWYSDTGGIRSDEDCDWGVLFSSFLCHIRS